MCVRASAVLHSQAEQERADAARALGDAATNSRELTQKLHEADNTVVRQQVRPGSACGMAGTVSCKHWTSTALGHNDVCCCCLCRTSCSA